MEIPLAMDEFYPLDHLIADHKGCLKIKSSSIVNKKIFQGLAEQVHYHHIVLSFTRTVVDVGDTEICGSVLAG